jgi:hypothetical protein
MRHGDLRRGQSRDLTALVGVAALPVDLAIALTELLESRGVECGDPDFRAADGMVNEVVLDERGDACRPFGELEWAEGDSATPSGNLIGPDREDRLKSDDPEALQR